MSKPNIHDIEKSLKDIILYRFRDNITGIIVPLYTYPADIFTNTTYNNLMGLAREYPSVPIVTILNPDSGPGDHTSTNYSKALDRLIGSGIKPIGYITSDHGNLTLQNMKTQIDNWLLYYPKIRGFFVDEVSSDLSNLEDYIKLKKYIQTKGNYFYVGNTGTGVDNTIINTFDVCIIKENDISSITVDEVAHDYSDGMIEAPRYKKGIMAYNQPNFDKDMIDNYSKHCGWIYFTNYTSWDNVSDYMVDLVKHLSLNKKIDHTILNKLEDFFKNSLKTINGDVVIKKDGDVTLTIEADINNTNEHFNPKLVFKQDGGSTICDIGIDANTNLYFKSHGTNSIVIDSDGIVKIMEKLEIDGIDVGKTIGNTVASSSVTNTSTSGEVSIDWTISNKHSIELSENTNMTFINPTKPSVLFLKIKQDSTGGWSTTFPNILTSGGSNITQTTSADSVDLLKLYFDGTDYYLLSFLQDMK